jgi:hypothetical protein
MFTFSTTENLLNASCSQSFDIKVSAPKSTLEKWESIAFRSGILSKISLRNSHFWYFYPTRPIELPLCLSPISLFLLSVHWTKILYIFYHYLWNEKSVINHPSEFSCLGSASYFLSWQLSEFFWSGRSLLRLEKEVCSFNCWKIEKYISLCTVLPKILNQLISFEIKLIPILYLISHQFNSKERFNEQGSQEKQWEKSQEHQWQ